MADMMVFPDTVEEFMEQYKMVDREEVYSNGTEYVPIYRMNQWFDHIKAMGRPDDTIRRGDAIRAVDDTRVTGTDLCKADATVDRIKDIPAVESKGKVIANIYFDENKLQEITNEAVKRITEECNHPNIRNEAINGRDDDGHIGKDRHHC